VALSVRHWDSLTDAQRLWVLLRRAGSEGVHSHDIRAEGISGNPSQRAKDVTSKGQQVFTAREPRGKRPGSRYWLAADAPDFAVPVAPNAGTDAAVTGATDEPKDISEGEAVGRVILLADYTKGEPEWTEKPLCITCGETPCVDTRCDRCKRNIEEDREMAA
jgi:hypothetical protein